MFHTQEHRATLLTGPCMCTNPSAWLGDGYYFWFDEQDAFNWGKIAKQGLNGKFEIYQASIECSNIIDTVFNEEHYKFWVKQVDKAISYFLKKTGNTPQIRDINSYFKDRATWDEVTGVMFQDLPASTTYSAVPGFFFRKRIQLVAYTHAIVTNFRRKTIHP